MELHERLRTQRTETGSDPFAELKNRVHQVVITELGPQLYREDIDASALRARVLTTIRAELAAEQGLSRDDRAALVDAIADDTLGHGPVEKLLADPTVTEVMINGPDDVWVERDGRLSQTNVRFIDDSHLRRIINRVVAQIGRRVDEASPMVDARLPDGSRVNAIIPPLSLSGAIVTIRKFTQNRLALGDFVQLGTMTPEAVSFLEAVVKGELNIVVSGGTGSGKTTLLNALSASIGADERIITIEDAAELNLKQRHVVRLESRPANIEGQGDVSVRDLVRNSLRMRPDRIIVGEVRGAEALDMLQAMNTGHDGSLTTLHANSPRDALTRIETMVLMAGYDLPVRAIRQQLASALDVIVHLERMQDGTRRVTSITEVQGMETDLVTLQDIFVFRHQGIDSEGRVLGQLEPTGLRPSFSQRLAQRGLSVEAALFGSERTLVEVGR
jgi:pilus assembly protein CpaF